MLGEETINICGEDVHTLRTYNRGDFLRESDMCLNE